MFKISVNFNSACRRNEGDWYVLKVSESTLLQLLVVRVHCELSESSRGQSVINSLWK